MARRDPWLLVGLLAFFSLVFVAFFGERIAPHEAIYFVPEHGSDPRPYDPGVVFPFGSDVLGRDLFSVVLAGARTTLTIVVLSGLARVIAGALVAAVSGWWRPTRFATESLAEFASAVPATLVALILVKVFLKTDPSLLAITGALLVTGWAGPYRVIRTEVDRLRAMPFTQGAVAIGVGRWRLLWRHHLPHLAPMLAVNLSQQIVASLVLVAELGVLSVFVGASRLINIEESLTRAAIREVPFATITDPPEWGGLLASARTIESLWTTRWLFLIPGIAFAITAVAVALIGFALARRYARRDLAQDLRTRGAGALVVAVLALFAVATLVPERYAEAREWASAARAEMRPSGGLEGAFVQAGLKPLGASYAISRDASRIVQTGPATASVAGVTVTEPWPQAKEPLAASTMRSFVSGATGGGAIEAPLVFAARGISPADYPPGPAGSGYTRTFFGVDLGTQIKDYADDYAAIDVRGKVVLLVRFMGIAARVPNVNGNDYTAGPSGDVAIARAITRGAAGVIFVDVGLGYEMRQGRGIVEPTSIGPPTGVQGIGTYLETERMYPVTRTSGVPVVMVSSAFAKSLLAPLGLDLAPFLGWDVFGDSTRHRVSAARDLGVTARVEVPLERQSASVTSLVGEVADVPDDAGRVVVWAVRKPTATNPADAVLAAVSRALGGRRVPFVFVEFDPSVDAKANADAIRKALGDRRITLVLVLDFLDGSALQFTTPHGDLIPALDMYADKAGARYEVTRLTAGPSALGHLAPFSDVKTVLVSGNGRFGDVRPDSAALVGYLAGRLALGAEEVPR
jgi:peptide/nickel transport system permease protein